MSTAVRFLSFLLAAVMAAFCAAGVGVREGGDIASGIELPNEPSVSAPEIEEESPETLVPQDFNQNGIDDIADILAGAKKDARNRPTYNSAYYVGGYPPENIGVCTDVVWRAFREAGYSLRDMVHTDIVANTWQYPAVSTPDNNIDFRRVRNLCVFFRKYAHSLTCDINETEQWQAGDIVIFGDNLHIGIVSDIRNAKGQPYIIHNSGQKNREEDYLSYARRPVTAHFRFDPTILPEHLQIPFK